MDKELDRLSELELELKAMKELKTDEDILEKQRLKVNRQRNKVAKLIETSSNEQK